MMKKEVGGWISCKTCVHMHVNAKMISVEVIPWIREGGNKRVHWKEWIQVWCSWYIVRTFISATMYSHPTQQQKKNKLLQSLLCLS
jgi:hypothetical protein